MNKIIIAGVVIVIALVVGVIAFSGGGASAITGDAVLYKSSSCGCCGIWGNYAKGKGLNVDVKAMQDISAIKSDYGVPNELQSCHTTIIEGYFVEGHIPIEAVQKLLEEKPDIAGIAMPGMPSGSPGMPGAQTQPFIVYAVNHDGTYEEFITI